MKYDVVIIGGGASGLMLAANLDMSGRRGLILEKTGSPGTKLLMSGGGRCNITRGGSIKSFIKAYGRCKKFFILLVLLCVQADIFLQQKKRPQQMLMNRFFYMHKVFIITVLLNKHLLNIKGIFLCRIIHRLVIYSGRELWYNTYKYPGRCRPEKKKAGNYL